jgi:ethanolamine utilization protein EutQ (cupin superfamily)
MCKNDPHLQRLAAQIVAQLPEDQREAEAVLQWAQRIIRVLTEPVLKPAELRSVVPLNRH